MRKAKIGIIGAGVVGTAIAKRLASSLLRQDKPVIIVLEKNHGVGLETSQYNSGVIHSGFHQKPGSLKAELARKGSQMMQSFIHENLPSNSYLDCGMLIAVSGQEIRKGLWKEWRSLYYLFWQGQKNKIDFKLLGPVAVKKKEPLIKSWGGIFIPGVFVVDPLAVTQAFFKKAADGGVEFLFEQKVQEIKKTENNFLVATQDSIFEFDCLINATGLYADEVARLAGINKYQVYPWRGEYCEVVGMPDNFVNSLVYPATPTDSPSKGIHFRPRLNKPILIGPTAKLVNSKENYNLDREPLSTFLKAAQKFYPQITEKNLRPSYAGIRPKLSQNGGEEDFVISLDSLKPHLLNLIAVESPGFSASLAIAEYVHELLKKSGICP